MTNTGTKATSQDLIAQSAREELARLDKQFADLQEKLATAPAAERDEIERHLRLIDRARAEAAEKLVG